MNLVVTTNYINELMKAGWCIPVYSQEQLFEELEKDGGMQYIMAVDGSGSKVLFHGMGDTEFFPMYEMTLADVLDVFRCSTPRAIAERRKAEERRKLLEAEAEAKAEESETEA